MALTVQQPAGALTIIGALASTPLPSGVTITQPTDGNLLIIGAVVMGQIVNGIFVQQIV